jgi:hypothetical protein
MATITTIESTDVVASSREVINTNFSNLNDDKQEKAQARTDLAGGTALAVGTHYYDALSANRTLTFSGTPAEGSRVSVVFVVTNAPTLTIPSSKRVGGDNTAITSLAMANGVQALSWEYRNAEWLLADTLAVSDLPAVISQAEAVGATDTNARLITGQRLGQAIAALAAPKSLAENAQTGTTYTLVLADAGKIIGLSNASAVTLTVPPNGDVAFPVGTQILLEQVGGGQVTVAPGSGVTLRSRGGALKLNAQFATAVLIKRAADTWSVSGDITT